MYTQCPHCETCFRIAEAHLKAAKGMVRCGSCKEVFTATDHLYDTLADAQSGKKISYQETAEETTPAAPSTTISPQPQASTQKTEADIALEPQSTSPSSSTLDESKPIRRQEPYISDEDLDHIDLGSAPDRSNAPDQSRYMESVVGKYSRYNNLDDMGSIDIPGEPDFTESFVQFVNNEYDPNKKITAPESTKAEAPATNDKPEPAPEASKPATKLDPNLSENPFIRSAYQPKDSVTSAKEASADAQAAKETQEFNQAPDFEALAGEEDEQGLSLSDSFVVAPPPEQPSKRPNLDKLRNPPERLVLDEDDEQTEISYESADDQAQVKQNEYQDLDSIEPPTSKMDIDGIGDLYSTAQEQMQEPIEDPDQLNRDIEALLNDAMSLDESLEQKVESETFDTPSKQNEDLANIDYLENDQEQHDESLSDFEQELQDIDLHSDSHDLSEQASQDGSIDFDLNDLDDAEVKEPAQGEEAFSEDSILNTPADTTDDEDFAPSAVSGFGDLPAIEEDELPKALRDSFEYLDRPPRPIGTTIALGFGIFALVLMLFGQMVYFRSYQLANQFPGMTSFLSSLCQTLSCRYSGSIDVKKIELLSRNVVSHPTQKNALLIRTSFRNNASFDQPYPILAIKLSDLSGHIVATRYFRPEEYLEGLYSKFLLMESGTPIHISLAVLDPGDDAINFEFSFY